MSCGVGCRHGSDLALLWLWRRPAATVPIRPLAWEPPYAMGAALEKAKRPKRKKEKERFSDIKKKKKKIMESSCRGAVETNPTRKHEVAGSIPDLAQWVMDLALP